MKRSLGGGAGEAYPLQGSIGVSLTRTGRSEPDLQQTYLPAGYSQAGKPFAST
jgi:hypothetical protein